MNDIVDMSQFVEAKSDQLNSDDLIGSPRTITVRKVTGDSGDQPVAIYYEGDNNKPFKPCKTVRRILLAVWGRYGADYVGKSMTLYRDDEVTFGGLALGGIRVSHMSHLDKETVVVVAKSKGKKAGVKILPLAAEKPKPDPATTWANGYIAKVNASPDADALEAFVTEKAAKLAELETKRPELHAECVTAVDARRADFSTFSDGGDDFDAGDQAPLYAEPLAKLHAAIETASASDLTDLRAGYLAKLKEGLPDEVAADVEARFAGRARELERGE